MLIKYVSERNGYSGVLYGESSMVIYDPKCYEVLHTRFRAGDTLEYLKEVVDTADKLRAMLNEEADNGQSKAD